MTETEHMKCDLCHEVFVATNVNRGLAIAVVRYRVNSHFRWFHPDSTIPYPNTMKLIVNARPSTKEKMLVWRHTQYHSERRRQWLRAYRQTDKWRASSKAYRAAHLEQVRATERASSKAYRAAHLEQVRARDRASSKAYRAHKAAARRKARA
jgi:hypothetical protein